MSRVSETVAIETVAIVGSGAMGRGIAESCLRGGVSVILHDANPVALEAASTTIAAALQRAVAKEQLSAAAATTAHARLITSTSLEGIAGADLVIEAVPERLDLKLEVLQSIEAVVSAATVIASNTSSIPITRLSVPFADPSRFLGLHFFNPASKMPLVEVISTLETAVGVRDTLDRFVRDRLARRHFWSRTAPVLWSTPCSSRFFCRPHGCWTAVTPAPKPSMRACGWAAGIRWGR